MEGDSCALKMRGLPFKVTVDEIKQFFSKYKFVEGSIKIG
jgi:RNA recognition motif-containing protein